MQQTERTNEVARRRTFAIISHPDAGKTTLTEKLLLYGGAIRQAGSVKGRKADTHAVSDWMEIEKQRGISVTSSVMNFDYENHRINILDTPGHKDFSEDTYRTLVAADSAVMLLDGAKGVEEQTKKLFRVCRMRGIPIFTFINKLDRFCKDPFELLEEIETVLGIQSYPVTWPVGGIMGNFKGVYNRQLGTLEFFEGAGHGSHKVKSVTAKLDDERVDTLLGSHSAQTLRDDIALLDSVGETFDLQRIQAGTLTPVFFGSAMTNFGVQQFLEDFIRMAPPPSPRKTDKGEIFPDSEEFTGFVFKIQANMDPKHRDRLAFVRICSGEFEKGMSVYHTRLKKQIKLAQPQQFLAQERTAVQGSASAGDIIGLFDAGNFRIGDTLCAENNIIAFEPIPMFPSEHFAEVTPKDSSKRKQFIKGIEQLAVEGAIQTYRVPDAGVEKFIVGVAGALQIEVLAHRMINEYNTELRIDSLPHRFARWVTPHDTDRDLNLFSREITWVNDRFDRPVVLFPNEWLMRRAVEKNPKVTFSELAPIL